MLKNIDKENISKQVEKVDRERERDWLGWAMIAIRKDSDIESFIEGKKQKDR